MVLITQHSRHPHFRVIFATIFAAALAAASSCAFTDEDPATAARRVGETDVPDRDVELTITSGSFRSSTSDFVEARSAAPVARVRASGGPDAEGIIPLRLTNIHRDAVVTVVSVEFPDATEIEGCPETSRDPIPCSDARDAIGDPCGVATDCPSGLTCLESTCQPATSFALCDSPTYTKAASLQTTIDVDFDVPACRTIQLDFELPEALATEPLNFAAIGSTDSLDKLREAIRAASDPEPPDFIAVLGENVESADTTAIDNLERALRNTGVPIVYIAGSEAVSVDSGEYALRKLGPHDHVFGLKGVRFVTFFSAERELGTRGFERLETFLRQAERLGDGPLMAFTHTVPIDPNGVRDQGFKSRIEGARTTSLLKNFGVEYVFTGRINDNDSGAIDGMEFWITSAQDAVIRKNSSYLDVTATPPEDEDRPFDVNVRSREF